MNGTKLQPALIGLEEMKTWLAANSLGFCTLGNHAAPLHAIFDLRVEGSYIEFDSPRRVRRFTDTYVACAYCRNNRHSYGRYDKDEFLNHIATPIAKEFRAATLNLIRDHHLIYLNYGYGQAMLEERAEDDIAA